MSEGGLINGLGLDVGIIVILLVVLVIILTMITVSMSIRLTRLTKKYYLFMRGRDGQSMEKMLVDKFKQLDALAKRTEDHAIELEILNKNHNSTLTRYGMVKYDAFDDVGGKMSFALAMLDSTNTGFILDAIHSRDNCFLYFKEIVKGESYIMLSDEEVEALKIAVNSEADEII
ncbi:MAG: DUF4446 family protein [Lachnospiraceae bacterium]|nr:DUF4446 family protein [Lachnospiraceae bacterium]